MRRRTKIGLVLLSTLFICFAVLSILKYVHRNNIFQFTPIEIGNIKNTITITGILFPKSKVEVGTQISGTFEKIYVDYTEKVEKGQVLAELDKRLLQAALEEAQAELPYYLFTTGLLFHRSASLPS
jgi:HlyD family secretion protein